MGAHAALGFHRGEKIFLYTPFSFQLRRKIDNMQPAIADLSHLHHVGTEIVSERAAVTVNFHSITRSQGIDTAKLQHSFGAIIESAKDGQQIGNDDFVTLADWVNDFSAREDTVDLAKPALQHFDI